MDIGMKSQTRPCVVKSFVVLKQHLLYIVTRLLTSFILLNSFVLFAAIPRDSNSFIHQPYFSLYSFLVDVISQLNPHYVI